MRKTIEGNKQKELIHCFELNQLELVFALLFILSPSLLLSLP